MTKNSTNSFQPICPVETLKNSVLSWMANLWTLQLPQFFNKNADIKQQNILCKSPKLKQVSYYSYRVYLKISIQQESIPLGCIPRICPHEQTDITENITLMQLRWRAVINGIKGMSFQIFIVWKCAPACWGNFLWRIKWISVISMILATRLISSLYGKKCWRADHII